MIDAAAFVAAHNEAEGIVPPAGAARVAQVTPAVPAAPIEYARAPAASGPQQTGGRPAATQRSPR